MDDNNDEDGNDEEKMMTKAKTLEAASSIEAGQQCIDSRSSTSDADLQCKRR